MTPPLSILFGLTCVAALCADAPPTPPDPTVGSVYGKAITRADVRTTGPVDPAVRFNARDTARWELMGRIMTAFGKPVVDRFVAEKKIDASADEVEAFRENSRKRSEQQVRKREEQLAKIKADLASADLPDPDRAKLEKTKDVLEKVVPTLRESAREAAPEGVARHFIVAWKIERELHRTYGGRVIFQQAGLEALDARRQLFEQAEKQGDLKFEDAGVRHLFYYYYANMKHNAIDEEAIERAWFFEDPK